MNAEQNPKRVRRSRKTNEWLHIVALLDRFLAKRASTDPLKRTEALIDNTSVEALNTAYAATLCYYTAIVGDKANDPKVQRQISRLWEKAGTRMKRYDPALAGYFNASDEFWSNAVTWKKRTIQRVWAYLNSIRTSTNLLTSVVNNAHHPGAFSSSLFAAKRKVPDESQG